MHRSRIAIILDEARRFADEPNEHNGHVDWWVRFRSYALHHLAELR